MQSLSLLEGVAAAPYVGVRSYDAKESHIFTGREVDIAQVGNLVANRARWRIILLHGQTGCGKSSFLKAGLIPEITSPSFETAVYDRSEDKSYSRFITSSADPMARLAGVAVDLLRHHVPASEQGPWCDALGLSQDLAQAERALSDSASLLARWFAALAPRLNRPLLLVIDQAEELFTLGVDDEALQARSEYFDFLAMHGERSSWIQLLISMRTEFYGRFDHELRCRLGASMPVAPYYLEAFSAETLENAVTEPLRGQFQTPRGQAYTLTFDPTLPRRIAHDVITEFPGPGALTCLQIMCTRLWQQALEGLAPQSITQHGPSELQVTHAMYQALGSLKNVLEDVVDQAVGDFCEQAAIGLVDSMLVWREAKNALISLVSQQTGGAPSTTFMLREQFTSNLVARMKSGANSLPKTLVRYYKLSRINPDDSTTLVEQLVTHLLRPDVRVLREIAVIEPDHASPTRYLALGHDVLTVGLAEAATRNKRIDDQQAADNRRVQKRMIAGPVVVGAIGVVVSYITTPFDIATLSTTLPGVLKDSIVWMLGGFYLVLLAESFRSSPLGKRGWLSVVDEHISHRLMTQSLKDGHTELPSATASAAPPLEFMAILMRIYRVLTHGGQPVLATGHLFRSLSADARHDAGIEGKSAFPGQPRY